ncbi:hypothetical protein THAOC_01306, partial [Thalassiosira oceanica]
MLHPQGSVASLAARPQPTAFFPAFLCRARTEERSQWAAAGQRLGALGGWGWGSVAIHGQAVASFSTAGSAGTGAVVVRGLLLGAAATGEDAEASRACIPPRRRLLVGRPDDSSSRGHLPTGCARRGVAPAALGSRDRTRTQQASRSGSSGDRGERKEDPVGRNRTRGPVQSWPGRGHGGRGARGIAPRILRSSDDTTASDSSSRRGRGGGVAAGEAASL